jgi:hypothetical protein
MTLSELLKAVDAALKGSHSLGAPAQLAQQAQQIAAMVDWAPGAIDAQGRLDQRLLFLQEQLKARFLEGGEPALAELHDALGDLRQAIAEHDLHCGRQQNEDDDYLFI